MGEKNYPKVTTVELKAFKPNHTVPKRLRKQRKQVIVKTAYMSQLSARSLKTMERRRNYGNMLLVA